MNLKDLRKLGNIDKDDILNMFGLETKPSKAVWVAGALGTFGVGMLVGAGIALMLAPKAGRELRNDIRQRMQRGPEDASHMATDLGIGREGMGPAKAY
jgi:hypothetical protein